MSKTMKAAVVRKFGAPLSIDEVPIPQVSDGMIQVAIRASGVCHTDLHAAEGDWPVKPEPPFIPGHEGVGTVVGRGEGVTRLAEGDVVGSAWLWSACGACEFCDTGWETLCHEQQNTGSPFYRELRRYRKKVNEEARAFVVDVAPYGGVMVPTEDENTFYCFGWSDNIISFIAQNTEGYKDLAAEVSGIDLCWEQ